MKDQSKSWISIDPLMAKTRSKFNRLTAKRVTLRTIWRDCTFVPQGRILQKGNLYSRTHEFKQVT
jgi:hypothetical protein